MAITATTMMVMPIFSVCFMTPSCDVASVREDPVEHHYRMSLFEDR